ncbi:hypothetical protein [Streptomyces sp. NPDC001743]|uniref:hypothetical protein n=1 Tax=Streptomyces sp. NPDC001743 TaxID=3154397 RepID=UPI00332180E0
MQTSISDDTWVWTTAGGCASSHGFVSNGWGQYTQISGKGDRTGDGETDIVARDATGTW